MPKTNTHGMICAKKVIFKLFRLVLVLLLVPSVSPADSEPGMISLTQAVVVCPSNLSSPEQKAVTMLIEETAKRSSFKWPVVHSWPDEQTTVIAVGQASMASSFAGPYAQGFPSLAPGEGPEGFHLWVDKGKRSAPTVFMAGNDQRGVLFGVGRLLRELHISRGWVQLSDSLDINTSPRYSLRGHQLGYRPKTNSYDGWTVDMWEQYIRDLVVFGANAVEIMPPRTDDDADSPHFPIPQMQMMVEMSRLLDEYGLDVWVWYPALDEDYSNSGTVASALEEWGAVFEKLPRVDAVFVPGGDPGHTPPKILMPFLEKQTEVLHRSHPKATMWLSPQGFNEEWMQDWIGILQAEQPKWLTGIVYGPQNRYSLSDLREKIPKQYPIRLYPDITHTIKCQYPVPDWDVAFPLTENREPINPRPLDEALFFHNSREYSIGFLTYSEGCNDDVNKAIWSALGWNPGENVVDILRQYSRYFIGDRYSEGFARGLLALEQNWRGPLLTNEQVYTTLGQFQEMERNATPQDLLNWRFQQALYRAYYDAYLRSRLIYETGLETQAMEILRKSRELGALKALDLAGGILDKAVKEQVSTDLRARIFELAEALYQSIRMQLSVPRYQAIAVGRGANLDLIDRPLNNINWLKEQFAALHQLTDEEERIQRIGVILNWTNPGPGGFYDDLGNLTSQPHLVRGAGADKDPEFRESSLIGFDMALDRRISWNHHAESRYDAPLQMKYENLDPNGVYKVRLVYAGDVFTARIQLIADDQYPIHPLIEKPKPLRPMEFPIPAEATSDGDLILTWTQEPGRGGNGRGCQVAEVWLIKEK